MKLLIDIGNTNASMAFAEGGKLASRRSMRSTIENASPGALKRFVGKKLQKTERIIIVSVVPKFLSVLEKSLRSIAPKVPVSVVGRDIHVPIKVKYKDPRQVGQDRLVTAYAALKLEGTPVISVDFGTAVTFDYVNRKGEYEGGLIFPGLRLGLESLANNTALLPKIDIKTTEGLIGKDTRSSMNKGVVYGYAALCDGIIERFKKQYGKNIKAVATGGDGALIAKHTRQINKVYPDLIFTGLLELSSPRKRESSS